MQLKSLEVNQMSRQRHGMRVWQCGICSYWSKRIGNTRRHHQNNHYGMTEQIQPAYAAMVLEPSYKITTMPSHYAAAFDTRISEMAKGHKMKTFDPHSIVMDEMQKMLEKKLRQTVRNNFEPSTNFAFSPSSYSFASTVFPVLQGLVCNSCYEPQVFVYWAAREPEKLLRSAPTEHMCKGKVDFESEEDRNQMKEKAHKIMNELLCSQVKEMLRGKRIVLRAERLTYTPSPDQKKWLSTQCRPMITEVLGLGVRPINNEELEDFLINVEASVGIFRDESGTYYRIYVGGLAEYIMPHSSSDIPIHKPVADTHSDAQDEIQRQ